MSRGVAYSPQDRMAAGGQHPNGGVLQVCTVIVRKPQHGAFSYMYLLTTRELPFFYGNLVR